MQSCVSALQTPVHVTDTVLLSFLIHWFDAKMRVWCSELYGFGSTDEIDKFIEYLIIFRILFFMVHTRAVFYNIDKRWFRFNR